MLENKVNEDHYVMQPPVEQLKGAVFINLLFNVSDYIKDNNDQEKFYLDYQNKIEANPEQYISLYSDLIPSEHKFPYDSLNNEDEIGKVVMDILESPIPRVLECEMVKFDEYCESIRPAPIPTPKRRRKTLKKY